MPTTDHGGPVTANESHRSGSRTPVRPAQDTLPPGAVQRAVLLVGAVHDEGPREVAMLLNPLTRADLNAVAVTLAAMVPADYTPAELLAWNDAQYVRPEPSEPAGNQAPLFPTMLVTRRLKPHGTHAAFNRHKNAGEIPCPACQLGEREYQAARPDRRKLPAAQHQDEASA